MNGARWISVVMAFGASSALGQDLGSFELRAERLSENVFVIEATDDEGWVNIVASVGDDGALLSDTGAAIWGERLKELLRGLGSDDVRVVVNTHYHSDHTSGNSAFTPEALTIAHPNTRRHLRAGRHPSPPLESDAPAGLLIDDEATIVFNGEHVHLWHFPKAHTDGDIAVYFSRSRVLHVGDIVLAPSALPYSDDVDGMIRTLSEMLQRVPADTRVVPGHGPVMSTAELEALRDILVDTRNHVRRAIRNDVSRSTMLREAPSDWAAWDSRYLDVASWLSRLYASEIDANGELVIVNRSAHEVAIVDAASYAILARLPVGKGPHEIALTPGARFGYVPNFGSYPRPHEASILPAELQWVEERGDGVTVIDLHEPRVHRHLDLPECAKPHGAAVSRDGSLVWITCQDREEVWEVQTASGEVAARYATGQRVSHMVQAVANDRRLLVTNVGSGSLTIIDRLTGEIAHVATGAGAEGMAVSPDEASVWVLNNGDDTLSLVDLERKTVVDTIESPGRFPIKAVFSPDGDELWVANNRSGTVSVIDTKADTHDVLATIELGSSPLGLLMSPGGDRVFVSTPRNNEVLVIDTESRRIDHRFRPGIEPDGMAWRRRPR